MASRFRIGARVQACNGDDAGRVIRANAYERARPHKRGDVLVAWDSGVRTWTPPKIVCRLR